MTKHSLSFRLPHLFDLESSFELIDVNLFVVSSDALELFGDPLQPAGVLVQTHVDELCCWEEEEVMKEASCTVPVVTVTQLRFSGCSKCFYVCRCFTVKTLTQTGFSLKP